MSKMKKDAASVREAHYKNLRIKLYLRPEGFNGEVVILPGRLPLMGREGKFSYRISLLEAKDEFIDSKKRFRIYFKKYHISDLKKEKKITLADRDRVIIIELNPEYYIHRDFARTAKK